MTQIKSPIVIFTDGSCIFNPGPASWAFVVTEYDREVFHKVGAINRGTNNVAEMTAVIEALAMVATQFTDRDIVIRSDSALITTGIPTWLPAWKARGWKKSDKNPPENLDLWKQIDRQITMLPNVKFEWVRGHSGHEFNERANKLALAAARVEASRAA